MKILVVSQHCWPEPFNVLETCEMLQQLGHDVTVLTGLPNYPQGVIPKEYQHRKNRRQDRGGVRIVRSWLCPRGRDLSGFGKVQRIVNYFSFALAASNANLLKGQDFDIVFCLQFSPVLMAIPALKHARRRGVPCVIYSYDLWPEDMLTGGMTKKGLPYKIMKEISKYIYGHSDAIAVTSPDFKQYFKSYLGIESPECYYLPQYAEEMFEAIGVSGPTRERDKVNITFAGNVGGNQSIEAVVRAAALLDNRTDIEIHIVGSGSRLEECKRLSKELNTANVVFHGRQPLEMMPAYYAEADALLLPFAKSTNESLVTSYTIPRKFQSYLAAGKPIICSADGIVSQLVERNSIGFSCAAENPGALASAISEFADASTGEIAEMGKRAKALYDEEFSRRQFIDRMSEILRMVAE
jgi:glycosyltransferase involved in cell wall biosynthesis